VGLFDDFDTSIDWENDVAEFQIGLPVGEHHVIVSNYEVSRKDDGRKSMVFSYTVDDDDSPLKGKTHKEFQQVPTSLSTEAERFAASAIKTRLISFGIKPEQFNTVTDDDIRGLEGVLHIVQQRKNPQYVQVRKFVLDNPEMAGVSLPTSAGKHSGEKTPFDD
jgi:hypothetical protein